MPLHISHINTVAIQKQKEAELLAEILREKWKTRDAKKMIKKVKSKV